MGHDLYDQLLPWSRRWKPAYARLCRKVINSTALYVRATLISSTATQRHSTQVTNEGSMIPVTHSRSPLHRAHVDQSYDGAVIRLHEQFQDPDEASQI